MMDLNQAGIALKCRCGSHIAADMSDVLFADRGRVKVGERPIRCLQCGAIYRFGERLKYVLVPVITETKSSHHHSQQVQPDTGLP